MIMQDVILVINAGSSSLKIAIFAINQRKITDVLYRIFLEAQNGKILFRVHKTDDEPYLINAQPGDDIIGSMISAFSTWWKQQDHFRLIATGHRIVHGGVAFSKPVIATEEITKQIERIIPLAPLHLPYNLQALKLFQQEYKEPPHIACFDTAFHTTQPPIAKSFGLPKKYYDSGIYRYGFHGLSYQWVSQNFQNMIGQSLPRRTIIGHLGNGASMCALLDGKSIATSMGFSVIDGLMMSTRCGSIDPGVLLYLMNNEKMTSDQIEILLYKQSGMFGVSGESSDLRDLLSSKSTDAKFAIDLFVYRIQLEIGRLSSALHGLDCLIFTAGIGENSATIRKLITEGLQWLGVKLDDNKNDSHKKESTCISTEDSAVKIFVIHTNEERVIAQEVASILESSSGSLERTTIIT